MRCANKQGYPCLSEKQSESKAKDNENAKRKRKKKYGIIRGAFTPYCR